MYYTKGVSNRPTLEVTVNQKLPYVQRVPRHVRLARTGFVLGPVLALIGFLPHMAGTGFNGGTVMILLGIVVMLGTSVGGALALDEGDE